MEALGFRRERGVARGLLVSEGGLFVVALFLIVDCEREQRVAVQRVLLNDLLLWIPF